MNVQSDWACCGKCKALVFTLRGAGVCPAGGGHDCRGSGDYAIPHEAHPHGPSRWRHCAKCEALTFAGAPDKGGCPAGGEHAHTADESYWIEILNQIATPYGTTAQSSWRWCRNCQALTFGGGEAQGPCATGGLHDDAASGAYWMFYTGEDRAAVRAPNPWVCEEAA